MIKLTTSDLLEFLRSKETTAPTDKLIIVGVLKDATPSSIQFCADNFTSWLTLPTTFIEEATCLGIVEGPESSKKECFPLFSISLKRPETQSERFLFNLIMPPFFMASKNRTQTMRLH